MSKWYLVSLELSTLWLGNEDEFRFLVSSWKAIETYNLFGGVFVETKQSQWGREL